MKNYEKKIIIPLPRTDFDPTETGVPWAILTQANINLVFATLDGTEADCGGAKSNGTKTYAIDPQYYQQAG